MAILPIRTYPDPVLSRPCQTVEVLDQEMMELADNMAETMFDAPHGIGLAAPQVGESVSLVVVDADPDGERGTPLILFNPRIVEKDGQDTAEEGCLSLPDHYAPVTRAESIVLEAMDRQGKPVTINAQGLLARCLQHEVDHLNGKLVVDYVSPLKRALYRKKRLKELKKEPA